MNIVHVVRSFGNKSQPYTTNLFLKLNELGKYNHIVASEKTLVRNAVFNLDISTKTIKNLFNVNLLFIIKVFLFDKSFSLATKKLSLKKKIHFIMKWAPLIKSNVSLIHVHHLQVFNSEILEYFSYKSKPVVVSLRGRDLLVNTKNNFQDELLTMKLKKINHVHLISEFMKNQFILKKIDKPTSVVYRGVSEMKFKEKLINRQKNIESIRLISTGRLVWEKGHIYLIESIYRLRKENLNITLDIYGVGELFEFLNFRIEQLGLSEIVKLKGFVANVKLKNKINEYDIAVQPSLSEALSNGLLEFVSNNIPCVISNVGGMLEIIKNDVNGIVFDILTPNKLDNAIKDALNINIEELTTFNNKILEKFSLEAEVKNLEIMYTNVLNEKKV